MKSTGRELSQELSSNRVISSDRTLSSYKFLEKRLNTNLARYITSFNIPSFDTEKSNLQIQIDEYCTPNLEFLDNHFFGKDFTYLAGLASNIDILKPSNIKRYRISCIITDSYHEYSIRNISSNNFVYYLIRRSLLEIYLLSTLSS